MIGLEHPWFLAALGVAVPVLWLLERHRRRRRVVAVSSLRIWRRVEAGAATPARRRRLNARWLLALTAVLGMVGAASGPYHEPDPVSVRELTVLVDRRPGMAAMNAQGRTRLEVALAMLEAELEKQPSPVWLRLITVPSGREPGGGAVLEPGEWKRQLRSLTPASKSGDFPAACAGLEAFPGPCLVVTEEPPPAWIAGQERIAWLSVGDPSARNLGLIWARATRAAAGSGVDLNLGVLNGGTVELSRPLVAQAGSRKARLATVKVAPGAVWVGESLRLPAGFEGQPFVVRLDGEDQLAMDDQVRFRPRVAREIRVVSAEPVPPEVVRVLRALGARPVTGLPGRSGDPGPAVYWKGWPQPDGSAPSLIVAPEEGGWQTLQAGQDYRPVSLRRGPAWSEVSGVAPYPDRIRRARRIQGHGDWNVALVGVDSSGQESPLVLERNGITLLAFDPVRDADRFAEHDGFPALFYRALGRVGESFAVEGLLDARETRLGKIRTPWPLTRELPASRRTGSRQPWGTWLLLVSLLALVAVFRLEA